MGDLLAVLLAPYDDLGAFNASVRVAVQRMGIGEGATTGIALVFLELATNSLKYVRYPFRKGRWITLASTTAIILSSRGSSGEAQRCAHHKLAIVSEASLFNAAFVGSWPVRSNMTGMLLV